MSELISITDYLREGCKVLREQIEQHDLAIQNETFEAVKNTLLARRELLQTQLDYLDRCIIGVQKIEKGEVVTDAEDTSSPFLIRRGEYKDIPKLGTVAQAYLAKAGKPITIGHLVDALNYGGYRIHNKRAKTEEDKYKFVEGRHIRIMASNDVHEKHPRADGFYYGATYKMSKGGQEMIALRNSDTDAEELPKTKGGRTYSESRHGALNLTPTDGRKRLTCQKT